MNQNIKNNEQLDRMKALMNYGLKTENKHSYSAVEYQKLGADGKVYGIVREGTKYYIKSASNKQNLTESDFSYIGGFRNRKDNEYSSYANAQKQFDLKMMSIKEACNKRGFSVDSWDLDKKEAIVIEASDKMKKEILRERQIMKNAMMVAEKKGACPECGNSPCTCNADDVKDSQKDNMKSEKPKTGDAKSAVDHEDPKLPKEMTESKVNEEEVLGWNRNDDYMDKSQGTEIGDSAPFNDATARNIDDGEKQVSKTGEMENGVVEGKSMHDADNQNTPTPGTNKVGDNQPFDGEKGKQIDEAIDGLDDDTEDLGDESGEEDDELAPADGEEMATDDEFGDEEDDEEDPYSEDTNERIDRMEDLIAQIAEKLGINVGVDEDEYEDDDLFDGGDESDDYEYGYDEEEEPVNDEVDMEEPVAESRSPKEKVYVYESAGFKRALRKQKMNEDGMKPFKDGGRVPSGNMNKLDDFGKHPAYQKKVMELPPKDMQEKPGYYDINDDSVRNDIPYGENIGDGAPFEIDPEIIKNAVSEAIQRFKKKQ